MDKVVRKLFPVGLVIVLSLFLNGCVTLRGTEKLEKLDYTVVKPNEIPQNLLQQIEDKKEACFELVYSDNEYLYIAKGYGEQETGGYSIQVEECYGMENVICVKTTLAGPQVGESVNKEPSYPYIVLKLEFREEKVKFL